MGRNSRKKEQQRNLRKSNSHTPTIANTPVAKPILKPTINVSDTLPLNELARRLAPNVNSNFPENELVLTDRFEQLPKISNQILLFARPIFDLFGEPDDARMMKRVLSIPVAVWNVLRVPDKTFIDRELSKLKRHLREHGPGEKIVDLLVEKNREFVDDTRMVLEFDVIDEGDSLRVIAAAKITRPN